MTSSKFFSAGLKIYPKVALVLVAAFVANQMGVLSVFAGSLAVVGFLTIIMLINARVQK